mmetsp:Transcript_68980/g.180801  ORF Transcript_68980/g.180801 Transcript_68980/m.180801 type:complete len:206 (-) Transcript_68980:256-873(-)
MCSTTSQGIMRSSSVATNKTGLSKRLRNSDGAVSRSEPVKKPTSFGKSLSWWNCVLAFLIWLMSEKSAGCLSMNVLLTLVKGRSSLLLRSGSMLGGRVSTANAIRTFGSTAEMQLRMASAPSSSLKPRQVLDMTIAATLSGFSMAVRTADMPPKECPTITTGTVTSSASSTAITSPAKCFTSNSPPSSPSIIYAPKERTLNVITK